MFMMKTMRKITAVVMATFMFATAVPFHAAQAAMVTTESFSANSNAQSQASNRDLVASFIERQDVQQKFAEMGVSAEEAEMRVATMTDVEIAKLADTIKSDPAGQGAVGAVVGAFLIVFFVLLITDLVGATNVYDIKNK